MAQHGRELLRSFHEHRIAVESARFDLYRRRAQTRVRGRDEFERQREFVLSSIDKDDVTHSFMDDHGQAFDCIPVERQPALRNTGRELAQPPILKASRTSISKPNSGSPQLSIGRKDRFGNAMECPKGTVALRRITLEEVTRFPTLRDYLRKPTTRPREPLAAGAANVSNPHAYAFQNIANLGGHTILSVWSPTVATDQVFSLAQQWCLATGASGTQTVEAGWQVYPQMYGHTKPVLFVYWTPDGYQTGSYDCTNFVKYGSTSAIGFALDEVSVSGGQQIEIELCFYLSQGNWWLFLNGIDQQHAIGYFPISLFAGGPMATGATTVEFGGETAGITTFPPMGSGAFANAGAGFAAYQRSLHYFSQTGDMQPAELTAAQEWAAAYTIAVGVNAGADPAFYFGGPGGA
jgi:hypothetical protein